MDGDGTRKRLMTMTKLLVVKRSKRIHFAVVVAAAAAVAAAEVVAVAAAAVGHGYLV